MGYCRLTAIGTTRLGTRTTLKYSCCILSTLHGNHEFIFLDGISFAFPIIYLTCCKMNMTIMIDKVRLRFYNFMLMIIVIEENR